MSPRSSRPRRAAYIPVTTFASFRRPLALAVHIACAGLLVAAPMNAALAQQTAAAARSYDIPAGPLPAALTRFIGESGISLSGTADLARGKNSPGLRGHYSAQAGLDALLAGSGLAAQPQPNGSYLLLKQTSADEVTLKLVKVSGAGMGSTTEGTGSYTTGASSSATRMNLSLRETPQSVSVITRQRMDDQGLTQLTDVVIQTPGLTLNQSGNVGSDSSAIYSRGFAVENYQVDGIGQVYSGYTSIFQTSDMAMYDRVEVVRGATGLMNGVGTPSATINLIRKRAGHEATASVRVEAGSWDYYRTEFDAGAPINADGSVRGRLVAVYQQNNSYIDRLQERKKILYGVIDADLSENTTLSFGAMAQDHDMDGHARSGLPLFYSDGSHTDWSRSDSAASNWAYSKRHNQAYFVALEHRLNEEWLIKGTWNHAVSDYDEVLGYAAGGYANPVTGAGMSLWAGRWAGMPVQDAVDLYLSGSFTLFGHAHDLVVGGTSSRTNDETQSYGLWYFNTWSSAIPNIFTWDGNSPAEPFNPASGDYEVTDRIDSVYGSARFHVLDELSVILGARTTNWVSNKTTTPYATGIAAKNNRAETGEVTPYAAVVYDIDDHWSAYASYTDIFKPQSNRDVDGNFLDPLLGSSYEIGAKAEFFDQRLNFAAAVFKIDQDNLAVSTGVTGPYGTIYRAVSGTETTGYEMELNGEVAEGWQASISFSRAKSEDRMGERLNTNIPQSSAKLFTTYRIASIGNGLTVGGGARWQSEIYSENLGPARARFTEGAYTVVDLMAQYPITPQLKAALNLYNALDKEYLTSSSSSYYGAPRNVRLTLDMQF